MIAEHWQCSLPMVSRCTTGQRLTPSSSRQWNNENTTSDLLARQGRIQMAYSAPTVDDFLTRFPEFVDQDEDLIQALLNEAGRQADGTWNDTDRKNAVMYLAAHRTQLSGGSYDTGGLRSVSLGSI